MSKVAKHATPLFPSASEKLCGQDLLSWISIYFLQLQGCDFYFLKKNISPAYVFEKQLSMWVLLLSLLKGKLYQLRRFLEQAFSTRYCRITQSVFENIIFPSESFMLRGDCVVNICAFDIFDSVTLWIRVNSSLCLCCWKLWHLKLLSLWFMSCRAASGIISGHVSMWLVKVSTALLSNNAGVNYNLLYQSIPVCSSLSNWMNNCDCFKEMCQKQQETDHMWVFNGIQEAGEEVVKNALVTQWTDLLL